ncbi:Gamma-aminobutyric acid type B receptor subunit 1, partial [Cichlidogyrus casuarinus]
FAPQDLFSFLCHVKLWPLSTGFSLGFGALFSKAWLVYRKNTSKRNKSVLINENIDGNAEAKGKKSKTMSVDQREEENNPVELSLWPNYLIICLFLVVDLLVQASWQLLDPMNQEKLVIAWIQEPTDNDVIDELVLCLCHTKQFYLWCGMLFGPKALLLVLGLLLSFETRNAKVGSNSDNRFVALAVYNVFILSNVAASVTLILRMHVNAFFAFAGISICLSCGLTLGLLFVPKMVAVWNRPYQYINKCEIDKLINTESKFKIKQKLTHKEENSSSGFRSTSNQEPLDVTIYTGEADSRSDLAEEESRYRSMLIEAEFVKRRIQEAEQLGQELRHRIRTLVNSESVFKLVSSPNFCCSEDIKSIIEKAVERKENSVDDDAFRESS